MKINFWKQKPDVSGCFCPEWKGLKGFTICTAHAHTLTSDKKNNSRRATEGGSFFMHCGWGLKRLLNWIITTARYVNSVPRQLSETSWLGQRQITGQWWCPNCPGPNASLRAGEGLEVVRGFPAQMQMRHGANYLIAMKLGGREFIQTGLQSLFWQ